MRARCICKLGLRQIFISISANKIILFDIEPEMKFQLLMRVRSLLFNNAPLCMSDELALSLLHKQCNAEAALLLWHISL
jgi:hypothetical protein